MTVILDVKDLTVVFDTKEGPLTAVDQVSFQIRSGQTVGIVGESGCGKSVTSAAIMGLLPSNGRIEKGSISFCGQDLSHIDEGNFQKLRGGKIAMIFQEPMSALNPVMKVGKQITEQIKVHSNLDQKDARDKAIELLKKVGIADPIKRFEAYPHELSGGMRQRIMIAMALSCEPTLLIADEPTTALDVTIQAQVIDLLLELQDEYKMAIQFISHDLGVISEICDDVYIMYAGRIVEYSSAENIFTGPAHPYTNGLLKAVPRLDCTQEKLANIPGAVPSLKELGQSCSFRNRCQYAGSRCRNEVPIMKPLAQNHQVACFQMEA